MTTVPLFNVVQVPGFPGVIVRSGRLHPHLTVIMLQYLLHFPSYRVWDVNEGSTVNTLVHHISAVYCLKFNSDTLVTGSKVLRIFTYNTCTPQIKP